MTCDILMITYNRPQYTRMALSRLLETADAETRIWVWHNGDDAATLDVVKSMQPHPRLYRFHHSPENKKLNEPTNWLWQESSGDLLGKVDDDCIEPSGWIQAIRAAHQANAKLGVLACWRFLEEDFIPSAARKKVRPLLGGHKVLRSCSVQGSGYLMKRQCVQELGLLSGRDSFPDYCFRLAERGWMNGWYYPFLYEDHMDDPRSPGSLLKTDEDLRQQMPLSAQVRGDLTLDAWLKGIKRNARIAQMRPADPRCYKGWRWQIHRIGNRLRKCAGMPPSW